MGHRRGYGPRVFAVRYAWLSVLVLWLAACDQAPKDDTPGGALLLFLEAMDQAASDSTALSRAYALLNRSAREALDQRAAKAETLAGRPYHPWEMLAEGRFRLRFTPARHRMRTKQDGDRAKVTVSDAGGKQSVAVPLVREDGAWRVVLDVPPMYQPAAQPAGPPGQPGTDT